MILPAGLSMLVVVFSIALLVVSILLIAIDTAGGLDTLHSYDAHDAMGYLVVQGICSPLGSSG